MKKQPDKAAPSRIYKKKQPRERVHCLNLSAKISLKRLVFRYIRSPRCFEHKPISLEMHFQSCTIGYLEVPAISNCFSTPLAWEFEIPGFNCITVPGFGYLYGLA